MGNTILSGEHRDNTITKALQFSHKGGIVF